jgi:hypothetical protein
VVFNVPEDKVGVIKALAAQSGGIKVRLWGGTETLPARSVKSRRRRTR